RYAILAQCPEAVEERAADEYALRPERAGLEHVLAGTNAAIDMHFNLIADSLNDRLQHGDGGWSAIELATTMVRHDDCVSARFRRHPCVFRVENALEDKLAAPLFLDPGKVVPVELRVELFGSPGGEGGKVGNVLGVAGDVAERAALGAHHAKAPARTGCHLPDMLRREFRRGGKAVADILVALAENLEIKRQHQCRAARGLGAVDQVLYEIAILHHVKLEPERLLGDRSNVFDGADAHGRKGEGNAEGFGGLCGQHFA